VHLPFDSSYFSYFPAIFHFPDWISHFPDWIVARLGVMEFLASGLGDSALQNDQTYLRGIQHVDAGPRNPASFVLCDQLVIA
jgi:hypothetical protein